MKKNIIKKISENNHVSIAEAEEFFSEYCEDFASDRFFKKYGGVLTQGIGLTTEEADYIHNYLKSA